MERDEESGLQCHGRRYYAPWLGRWTSADPIGLGDGVNRCEYCHGNPVGGRDPSGLLDRGAEAEAREFTTDDFDSGARHQTTVAPELASGLAAVAAKAASLPRGTGPEVTWTVGDVAQFGFDMVVGGHGSDDSPGREAFRKAWFEHYGGAVATAAVRHNLPTEALLGIAYIEIGGDPTQQDPAVHTLRSAGLLLDRPASQTSFGNLQMQLRRVAETLGVEPTQLTAVDHAAIISVLEDPIANIELAAAYLERIQSAHPEVGGMSDAERSKYLTTWWNRGEELTLDQVQRDTTYGDRSLVGAARALEWMAP